MVRGAGRKRLPGSVMASLTTMLAGRSLKKIRLANPNTTKPIAGLTDRSIPIADVFDTSDREWEQAILRAGEDAAMIAQAESRLRARNPERTADAETVLHIV